MYLLTGAYEPLKVAKEHETYAVYWVQPQSKSITKYFPYKESKMIIGSKAS